MKTGYFESIINNHIKIIDDDKIIFFPQGAMGRKGYVIPDKDIETLLHKKIKTFYIILIVASGVLGGLSSHLIGDMGFKNFLILVIVATFFGWLYSKLFFHRITKNLESVAIKNTPTARWAEMGRKMSSPLLYGLTFIVLLFTILPLWLYTKNNDPKMLFSGSFFALMLIPYGIAIKNKIKSNT